MEDSTAVDRFELVSFLRWLVEKEGVAPAAKRLGVARGTVGNLIGGLPTNASTWAAIELRYRMLPDTERQQVQAWFDQRHRRVPLMGGPVGGVF